MAAYQTPRGEGIDNLIGAPSFHCAKAAVRKRKDILRVYNTQQQC